MLTESKMARKNEERRDIFQNMYHFPSFQEVPGSNDLDSRYYKEDLYTGLWTYACTWCFIAEITDDRTAQISVLRNRVLVCDRTGQDNIVIAFYPESGSFDFKTLKKGHTLCIMLPLQHYFLDGTRGFRIECLNSVKVVPCSLHDLLALSTVYSKCKDICWACQKKPVACSDGSASTLVAGLKRCAACRTAQYCGKECQARDWRGRHRRWCKAMPEFLKMAKIDYTTYKPHALFDSAVGRKWWFWRQRNDQDFE